MPSGMSVSPAQNRVQNLPGRGSADSRSKLSQGLEDAVRPANPVPNIPIPAYQIPRLSDLSGSPTPDPNKQPPTDPQQQQKPPQQQQQQQSPGGGNNNSGGDFSGETSAEDGQWGPRAPAQSCKPTADCQGNGVTVDLKTQCMCIDKGAKCFQVGIGSAGPPMTTSGTGRLADCNGRVYQSKMNPTTGYDNDCMTTGIPENHSTGKWLHKPANCMDARTYRTRGCIAVPCDMWPQVKAQKGQEIVVCNGKPGSTSVRGPAAAQQPRQGPQ